MKLAKCSNGHFYDADLNTTCPHCNGGHEQNDVTVALDQRPGETDKTVPLSPEPQTVSPVATPEPAWDDGVTKAYFEEKIKADVAPVVGWLVCIEGKHIGEDFRLKAGRNFVGRSSQMDVAITKDNSVSRDRHAIVVYDPKGNAFIVQPGEARELCYLNDQPVYSAQTLRMGDKLNLGETTLMFIPCCSSTFTWEDTNDKGDNE